MGEFRLPNFKIYYKATRIQTTLHENRPLDDGTELRVWKCFGSAGFDENAKTANLSQQMVLRELDRHMQNRIFKNKLKVDCRLKWTGESTKFLGKNIQVK